MIPERVLKGGELLRVDRTLEVISRKSLIPVDRPLVPGGVGAEGVVVEVGAVVDRVGRDDDGKVPTEPSSILHHHPGEHGREFVGEFRQSIPRRVRHQDGEDRDFGVAVLKEGDDGFQGVLAAVHGVFMAGVQSISKV